MLRLPLMKGGEGGREGGRERERERERERVKVHTLYFEASATNDTDLKLLSN